MVSVHEVAIPRGLWQTQLSPDGKVLAAYQYNSDLVLYNVETNEAIYTKKKFYIPNFVEVIGWQLTQDLLETNELNALNMVFSPDSKYFLAGRKGFRFFGVTAQETTALELLSGKQISIGGNVKKLLFNAFTFLGPDRIAGSFGDEMENSGIFAFPDGKRLDKFELGGNQIQKAEGSEYLVVRPVVGAAVAAFDMKAKKYTIANKKSAFDIHTDEFVSERVNGELAIYNVNSNSPRATLALPPSLLGHLRAVAVSNDGGWLTVSDRSRGAVWNVTNGERKFHTRGFQGSHFGADGGIYADFPKQDQQARTIVVMNAGAGSISPHTPITGSGTRQHGKFLVSLREKADGPPPAANKDAGVNAAAGDADDEDEGPALKNTVLEVRDVVSGTALWTRSFAKETPRYFITPSQNSIVFAWRLRSDAVKEFTAADPALAQRLGGMLNKTGDYLLQVLDANTGAEKGKILLETGEGSFGIKSIYSAGDNIVISDFTNRLLVYAVKTGGLTQRFFGQYATVSPSAGLIAVSNVPGRVTVYDLASGQGRQVLTFKKPLAMLQFLPDGKRLFALTTDQTAFLFDVAKL
jgi:WD40 repeat protein